MEPVKVITHYGIDVQELANRAGKHVSCYDDPERLRALCGNGSFHAKAVRNIRAVDCPACLAQLSGQYATRVVRNGVVVARSKNLRAMLRYAAAHPVIEVTAKPCDKMPYNGKLAIKYSDGATASGHWADYTVLLEFLTRRRSWRGPGIKWDVDGPAAKYLNARNIKALEFLHAKGVY